MMGSPPLQHSAQEQVNGLVERAIPQGTWLDADYLWLTDRSRSLVELTDGYLVELAGFAVNVGSVFDAGQGD